MTTLTGTPYGQTEAGAVYDQAAALLNDEFDTSGTPDNFCDGCEHAPCVTGLRQYCELQPRAIVVWTIAEEVTDSRLGWSPHLLALMSATRGLAFAAIFAGGHEADRAMAALVLTRDRIRNAVRERSEVAR